MVFGDERPVLTAVASTNVADPVDISENLMPILLQVESPDVRAQVEHFAATDQGEFGRNFDTGSCEIASATARRVGLGKGAERSLKEAVEWWNGEGPPQGLKGDEIAPAARVARAAADAARFDALGGKDAVVGAVKARSGGILDPAVVEALIANADELLAETRAGDPRDRVLEVEPEPVVETAFTDLTELARSVRRSGGHEDALDPRTLGRGREACLRRREVAEAGCSDTRPGSRSPRSWPTSERSRFRMRSGRNRDR